VATQAESLSDFGRLLRDWLHEVRRVSSRTQAAATIIEEPPRLADRFAGGAIADAWLAALRQAAR
jgi:hypothetical protein